MDMDVNSVVQITRKVEERDRVTAQVSITHESFGNDPIQQICVFSALLEGKEQCYIRRLVVGRKWVPLDLGWIDPKNVGMILLENRTGTGRAANPTVEEEKATESSILQIGYRIGSKVDPQWIVRPKRFHVAESVDCSRIRVRAAKGEVKLTVCIIPK